MNAMLPPIDDSLLQSNPNFALLYNKLTNTILNPDASTKDDDTPAAKQREAVRKELDIRRVKAAKHHLLTQAIATATPPEPKPSSRSIKPQPRNQQSQQRQSQDASPLPDPLIDLLLILPSILKPSSATIPPSSLNLLLCSPPFSNLDTLLPQLSPIIASSLHSSALTLARLAHPATNPSYLHRQIPGLPSHISNLLTKQANLQTSLSLSRLQTLNSLLALLDSLHMSLTHLIRLLELKHGIISRNLELRAAEASTLSQRTEIDAEQALWTIRRDVYSPEAVQALRNYDAHLRDARVRMEEKIRGVKAELAEYGVGVENGEGKERVMREMARVYQKMRREMQDTKGDLDRLQRG